MDICRSFSFVNLNIPPRMKSISDEKDLFHCDYITIGFFDGMKTELLSSTGTHSAFSSMWLYNERLALTLDGTHSFQNIFGFKRVDSEQDDSTFWSYETDRNYPLTFVTFLQMQAEKDSRTSINKQLQNIEAILADEVEKSGKKYVFSCYVTLDKNDFVICIKSKQFRGISSSILALHSRLKSKILYSYSVLSLNRQWLHGLAEHTESFPVEGMKDELIDSISLKGIANSVTDGNLSDKYRELCIQLDRFLFEDWEGRCHDSYLYDIMGDYDFRYIAREVPLKRLLLAIAEDLKPLNYESPLFRFALFSSNFVMNIQSEGLTIGESSCKPKCVSDYRNIFAESHCKDSVEMLEKKFGSPKCQYLMDYLALQRKTLLQQLRNPKDFSLDNTTYWTNLVSLWKLLFSLAALESAPTRKYDFHSLYWPYRMLIDMLDSENGRNSQDLPDDNLYGFIHGHSSTLNGTLRTDIQFFQVNDFNAIVHYAPAKLRAFYSAWTYELTNCYRLVHVTKQEDLEREYEFVIVPNTNAVIRTFDFNPHPKEFDFSGKKATDAHRNPGAIFVSA